jgi:phosphoglycolate phosphatase
MAFSDARAVLIDLDGTLVDTAPDIFEAVSRTLLETGARLLPFDTVRGFIGKGVQNLMRQVLRECGAVHLDEQAALSRFLLHYRDTNGRFGQVFPGVREGLRALRKAGYRLGCVTNKLQAPTAALLETHALASWFDVVVGGDAVTRMKPDPEALLHACRVLHAHPARCVLVGDSHVDVAAAQAARMPVFIVRYGYPGEDGHEAMQCEGFIDSFEELPALLDAQPALNA